MNQTTKKTQNTAGGGLYIALAICILSVICIGVYSAIISIFSPSENLVSGDDTPRIVAEAPPVTKTPGKAETKIPSNVHTTDEGISSTDTRSDRSETPEAIVPAATEPVFVLPTVGAIIQAHSDDALVYSETMNDYRVHNGVDIAAMIGERVKATSDGVVEKVADDPLMGGTVVIDHGNGLKSVYQNLSLEFPSGIREGVEVKAGDVIAGIGETSLIECAEEPHLHFEVWRNGVPIDPMSLFS